ncbi:MAG: hypothetical protein FJ086_05895 [Deltaproteobacteria bacterium]|nr:hypothetical protein [Deltaproteobacteria bacterium]
MSHRLATALLLLLVGTAGAEETVRVRAELVAVSSQGEDVDPPQLAVMRDEFRKLPARPALTSFRRLSEKRVVLTGQAPQTLPLPGGGEVRLALAQLKDDKALVSVEVPKLVTSMLELGKRGALYQQLTRNDRGQFVFLVLHPD